MPDLQVQVRDRDIVIVKPSAGLSMTLAASVSLSAKRTSVGLDGLAYWSPVSAF